MRVYKYAVLMGIKWTRPDARSQNIRPLQLVLLSRENDSPKDESTLQLSVKQKWDISYVFVVGRTDRATWARHHLMKLYLSVAETFYLHEL